MSKPLCLYAVFIAGFLLYLPAADGPYLVDDYPNLVNNNHLILERFDTESLMQAATSSRTSGIGRPLSMLSFALNYTLAGDKDAYPVKLVNILLHLLTGAGIYMLLKLLLTNWLPRDSNDIFWTALFATTVWLIHPLQVSTVLYSVQRMTILGSLFTVFGLLAYMKFRQDTIRTNSGYPALFLSLPAFTIVGVLAKENAALLPLFALLIEATCFRFASHPDCSKMNILVLKTMLFVPLLLILGYLAYTYLKVRGELLWPYQFTIDQRLLTQPRILMHYLGWITLVNPETMSQHHSDIGLSTGLLTPVTTLFSLAGLLMLVLAAGLSLYRQQFVVFGFGVFWFLMGHLIESTTIPLVLIYEHRNYLPMTGIVLISAYLLVHTAGVVTRMSGIRVYLCVAIILLNGFLGHARISIWSEEKTMVLESLNKQPDIPWSWSDAANYLSRRGNVAEALGAMRKAARLEPLEPAFIFGEAFIRCLHMPAYEFPEDFKSVLVSALANRPLTTASINSFDNMNKVCLRTRANDATLRQLYLAAANNPMGAIADIGRRALDSLDSLD